jgi:exonuclease SbcD
MIILHTGDLHYSAGIDEDIDKSLKQILEYLQDNPVDLITIGGDVYEKSSSIPSRNIVKERLKEMAQYAPIIICQGNHDQMGDLDILADLKAKYPIKVYSSPSVITIGDTNLYIIPWITKAHWLEAHKVDGIDDLNTTLSGQLLKYIKLLKASNKNLYHVVLSHVLISGARAENNQPLIGEGVTLGQYDLEEAGFDAGLFSHIHLRQEFGNGLFFYPGSPAAMDFGESDNKFFSVLDVINHKVKWIKINAIRRLSITGKWENGQWSPDTNIDDLNLILTRLRVSYSISSNEDYKLAKESIYNIYKGFYPLELKLDPRIEKIVRLRADNVSKAETLLGKLEEWWIATSQDPVDRKELIKKLKIAEDSCTTQESLFRE